MTVAMSRPPSPKCEATGTSTATKAAVGPVTWTRDPPSTAVKAPATIAVYRPCWGGTPEAMASAMESGSATSPTTRPAITSARKPAVS